MVFALFATIACGPADPADACREGTTLAGDGHCYPPLPTSDPDVRDVLDGLPTCNLIETEPAVDFGAGCADGACIGDTFTEIALQLGSVVTCVPLTRARAQCAWPDRGILFNFDDADEDGEPDLDAGAEVLQLVPPHRGGTVDGLGIGVSMGCFVEVLGPPNEVVFTNFDDTLRLDFLRYGAFLVFDEGREDDSGLPNGFADRLFFEE